MSDIRIGVLEFSDRPFPPDYVPPVGYGVDWSPDNYDNIASAAAGLRDAIAKVAVARGDPVNQVILKGPEPNWAIHWDGGISDWGVELTAALGEPVVEIGNKRYVLELPDHISLGLYPELPFPKGLA